MNNQGNSPKQWEVIGNAFVRHYYECFDDARLREQLVGMYHAEGMLTFEDNCAQGREGIKGLLDTKTSFQKIQHSVTKTDCQPTKEGGVIIMVTGQLQTDDDAAMGYSQTFYIKPSDGSFFIYHDIFRLNIHNFAPP